MASCRTVLRRSLAPSLGCWESCAAFSSSASLSKKEQGKRGVPGRPRPQGRRRKKQSITWVPWKPREVNPDAPWSSVYHVAQSFDPYLIPIPLRMGRPDRGRAENASDSGIVPPPAIGNLELMKIPNFFHLTPPAILKHCEALKPLCNSWPERLPFLPLRIETRNYVFPGHSVRHPGATKVTLKFNLRDLTLTPRARSKMIELAGQRYDPSTDTIQLVGKRCPRRSQNRDYVMYLLKVLYLESNRLEPWEQSEEEESTSTT